jgi:hypothetical protein
MKNIFLGSIIFLTLILVLGLFFAPFIKQLEGFSSLLSPGLYPKSQDRVILDDYPQIGKNETSNNNYSDIWVDYPVLPLASFKQITNNLRYHENPDEGTCVRADFCGALYKNKKVPSNVVNPLPPAEEGSGARVGYFRSEPNELYFSIPTNQNILY